MHFILTASCQTCFDGGRVLNTWDTMAFGITRSDFLRSNKVFYLAYQWRQHIVRHTRTLHDCSIKNLQYRRTFCARHTSTASVLDMSLIGNRIDIIPRAECTFALGDEVSSTFTTSFVLTGRLWNRIGDELRYKLKLTTSIRYFTIAWRSYWNSNDCKWRS